MKLQEILILLSLIFQIICLHYLLSSYRNLKRSEKVIKEAIEKVEHESPRT